MHTVVSGYVGAKTGKTYHATATALIEAPAGEFKGLKRGSYSLYNGETKARQDKTSE